jgi:DNA polymerase III subunit epsilon
MYAIVDIETTGGYAANNDITEVAIVLHDGQKVTGRYETLIRPLRAIPRYIQVLTGITPEMVADAPLFSEVAPYIKNLLTDRVFVAHNVNFDYSFLKHHLSEAGVELDCQRLCTVRLSKKVFPGLLSYSLGNICRHFEIPNEARHRAGGDADATTRLFELLLQHNAAPHIEQFVKRRAKEQSLPPNLPKEDVDNLPYSPGVYYFHDQKGKIVYVGKAKNLKYRVRSHFSHNGAGRQRQDFLRTIHKISYQQCSTELMAFIFENIEIRRLWPPFNYSQKSFTAIYGMYLFQDQAGFMRLAIDKKRKNLQPVYTFSLLTEGRRLLRQLIAQFELCPKLCFLQTDDELCVGVAEKTCKGACERKETAAEYNQRVQQAVEWLSGYLPTFAVVDKGHTEEEQSCILIEKGRFYGMGYLPAGNVPNNIDTLKSKLIQYPESEYIRGLIYSYLEKKPETKFLLQA